MKNFLRTLLTVLFPPSADQTYLVTHERTLTATPFTWQAGTLKVTSLFHYNDALVQALIRAAKFDNDNPAQHVLGTHLAEFLQQHFPLGVYLPMPLSPARIRQRGHNHIASILEAGGLTSLENIVIREHRAPQTSLPRQKRLTNLVGSFHLKQTACIEGAHIVLIDDVGTTGATLNAAYNALRDGKPASISLVTIAH